MADSFDVEALKRSLTDFLAKSRTAVPTKKQVYQVNEVFSGAPYWQIDRFESAEARGLLYRPDIVNAIVKKIELALPSGSGVAVKGPHGVGKSCSLINLVRKLESTGKYLVTFIPDCDKFTDLEYLYDAICQSFGSTSMDLKVDRGSRCTEIDNFKAFVHTVDMKLKENGKKWVFIFDQVNRLFARFKDKSYSGDFDFPFNQISHLLLEGRRICVISSSADNESTHSDNQENFNKYSYNHPLRMSKTDLSLAFPELKDKLATDEKRIIALTGGVPWQVYLRLQEEGLDEHHLLTPDQLDQKYGDKEIDRIRSSLIHLEATVHALIWKDIVKSAISCLMERGVDTLFFDRKYSYLKDPTGGGNFLKKLHSPLYPIVLVAYERFFWDDLMAYLQDEEGKVLNVPSRPLRAHDTFDRILENWEYVGSLSETQKSAILNRNSREGKKANTKIEPAAELGRGAIARPISGNKRKSSAMSKKLAKPSRVTRKSERPLSVARKPVKPSSVAKTTKIPVLRDKRVPKNGSPPIARRPAKLSPGAEIQKKVFRVARKQRQTSGCGKSITE